MRTIHSLSSKTKVSLSVAAIISIALFYSCKKSDNVAPPAAPAFAYQQKNISLAVDVAMTPVKPGNTGGDVTAFTVTPNLPKGILINAGNGEISGTASDTLLPTKYVVTATGPGGKAFDTLTLSVGTVAFNYGATGSFVFEKGFVLSTPISPVVLAG